MRLPFVLTLLVLLSMSVGAHAAPRAAKPIARTVGELPSYNIEAACRALTRVPEASISETTGPEAAKNCVSSEKDARDRLQKEWSQYTSANKAMCIGISKQGQIHPVYSELMTCLEMTREGGKREETSSPRN
jgi:hypothetical protein